MLAHEIHEPGGRFGSRSEIPHCKVTDDDVESLFSLVVAHALEVSTVHGAPYINVEVPHILFAATLRFLERTPISVHCDDSPYPTRPLVLVNVA